MKKFLVLFLVIAMLLVTGCSQKEESYVAYLSISVLDDGFSGHRLIDYAPHYSAQSEEPYQDPTAEAVKSLDMEGQVMNGVYVESRKVNMGSEEPMVIHQYNLAKSNGTPSYGEAFRITDSGQLRYYHYSLYDSLSDEYMYRGEAIEIAKQKIYDLTGVNVDGYQVETRTSYDNMYSFSFKKYINGFQTADFVNIDVCYDGFCPYFCVGDSFGRSYDDLDCVFDQDLVYQAVRDRILYATREIEKEYGKLYYYIEDYAHSLGISPDGKPYLSVKVRIEFPGSESLVKSTVLMLRVFKEAPTVGLQYAPETDEK